jgi:anti-anti-sigma factor
MDRYVARSDFFSSWLCAAHPNAYLRLAGDVDGDSRPALIRITAQVCYWAPETLYVDLGDLTFACSTLTNFVAQVAQALPPSSRLILCRAQPRTSRLLQLTGLTAVAQMRGDLPARWPGTPSLV